MMLESGVLWKVIGKLEDDRRRYLCPRIDRKEINMQAKEMSKNREIKIEDCTDAYNYSLLEINQKQ